MWLTVILQPIQSSSKNSVQVPAGITAFEGIFENCCSSNISPAFISLGNCANEQQHSKPSGGDGSQDCWVGS